MATTRITSVPVPGSSNPLARKVEILALPAPVVPGMLDDGVMLISALAADIVIPIPRPTTPITSGDKLVLLWGAVGAPEAALTELGSRYLLTDADFIAPLKDFELTLPVGALPTSGVTSYQFAYSALTGRGNNRSNSTIIRLTIDWREPGGQNLARVLFDREIGEFVTPADIDSNGFLPATVADYFDMEDLDWVMPWIGTGDPAVGALVAEADWVQVPPGGKGREVLIGYSREEIENYADGDVAFGFKLKDKAGNISALSPLYYLKVLLNSVPSGFLAPLVPLFDAELLLTDYNTRAGVEVQIPAYDNGFVGDLITLHWGSFTASPFAITNTGTNPYLPFYQLSYLDLLSVGSGNIDVWYSVSRGTEAFGDSEKTRIKVDLETPAGPDPEPSTPGNENLQLAVVSGASDNPASPARPNEISADDYGSNAVATIPWLLVDTNAYLRQSDVITVFWDGVPVAPPYTVNATDMAAEAPLHLPVNTSYVEFYGAGHPLITYTVTRVLADGVHVGTSLSLSTDVNVISLDEIPGGGITLPTATFIPVPSVPAETGDPSDYLGLFNRADAIDGVRMHILLDYTHVAAGDEIAWAFVGKVGYYGEGAEIPDTAYNGTYTVVAADIARGYYDALIPAQSFFRVCDQSATVQYTVTNGNGTGRSLINVIGIDVRNWTDGCTWPIP